MPTPFMGLKDAMKHLDLGPDDVVADPGCGAGHALQTFAHMTGCRGFGVELDAGLAKAATDALATTGLADRVEVRCGDATSNAGRRRRTDDRRFAEWDARNRRAAGASAPRRFRPGQ